MVALVRPRKGIEVLLEALAKTIPSYPNVSLDVIGPFETTEYEESVQKLIDTLGVREKVSFCRLYQQCPCGHDESRCYGAA